MNQKRQKQIVKVMVMALVLSFCLTLTCQATGADAITGKINNLYNLVKSIIIAIGAIVLIWGVFDFATAWQSHDSTQMTAGIRKIVSGVLMAGAGTVVSILG